MTKEKKIMKLLKNIDSSQFLGAMKYPQYGQFVFCGAIAGNINCKAYLGYCVQVREKAGIFGSHQVFLRHCNGQLMVHENQGFFALSKQQQKVARKMFVMHIKDEKKYVPYTIKGKFPKTGFFVPARQDAAQ